MAPFFDARASVEIPVFLGKQGQSIAPVTIEGRKIAKSFWGQSWCTNLERYRDYEYRLPRGRTYVRNGSVVDLQIASGSVTALVSGSSMYDVKVTVQPVTPAHWKVICKDCSGAIDSLVELLQGRFSQGVMTRLCEEKTGLFPSPKDILFTCSCPDWASMCKHVAAVLYGIGARLDQQPELLFTLRKVDHQDLMAHAGSGLSTQRRGPAGAKVLHSEDLSEMFGIEIDPTPAPKRVKAGASATKRSPEAPRMADRGLRTADSGSSKPTAIAKPPTLKNPAPTLRGRKKRLTAAARQAVSARMKKYWAERRAAKKKGR